MSKFITVGTVSAVLSVLAMIAGVFGKDALSVYLNDPTTAQQVFGIVSGVLAVVAGVSNGIKTPEA